MWIQVIFDLPVLTRRQRKAATGFRNDLLDLGFEMVQFSVYHRHCASKEMAETLIKSVEKGLPSEGHVHILTFTDKQFENIRSFAGINKEPNKENPCQLSIF